MKNITKNEKHEKKSKLKKALKIFNISFLTLIAIGASVVICLAVKFYPDYQAMANEADKIVENIDTRTFVRLDPTVIVRKNGELVKEFNQESYEYVNIEDIPEAIKEAFISIEDKNFYNHKGFDIKANLRATKALIKNKGKITQGGSTITQQLVKITFLTHEQTYQRKIKEILIAIRLEDKLEKDQILEYYINNIYYANGVYGIKAASKFYFNKDLDELSLAEIGLLVAIPNNPTIYNPIENMENTLKRKDRIISQMYEDGKITYNEMIEAKDEEVKLNITPKDKYIPDSYEVSYILSSATKLIMESEGFALKFDFEDNYDRIEYNKEFQEKFDEVYERVKAGGYIIESTIDPIKQEQLQAAIDEGLIQFTSVDQESGLYETQAAGVTIDNQTNKLIAIVGGRTQEGVHNPFNRAYLAYRQPGSVIKPIAVYGVEIDQGMLSSTVVNDVKAKDGPANSGGKYRGEMSAREALERSVNTVPFELMKDKGAKTALNYMKLMEFSNLVDEDDNAGISIGGFTYGTTVVEIASSFATLANNGNYIRVTGINTIKFDGEVIYENEKKPTKVYNDGSAYLLTDMLKGVLNNPRGTGYGLGLDNIPAAAKTGTTDDNKDGWFSGYTPYYTTAIWVGNDLPKRIEGLYGGTYPGLIWKTYMNKIHEGLEERDFAIPEGTKMMYLNPTTGFVSEVPKEGYTNYEIIPLHYLMKAEEERAYEEMIEREKEQERIYAESIRKEEFENQYGITEEEELLNRSIVEKRINQALLIKINNEDDYNSAILLLNEAKVLANNLKVESHRIRCMNSINEALSVVTQERDAIVRLRKEEEQRAEDERREKEEVDIEKDVDQNVEEDKYEAVPDEIEDKEQSDQGEEINEEEVEDEQDTEIATKISK